MVLPDRIPGETLALERTNVTSGYCYITTGIARKTMLRLLAHQERATTSRQCDNLTVLLSHILLDQHGLHSVLTLQKLPSLVCIYPQAFNKRPEQLQLLPHVKAPPE